MTDTDVTRPCPNDQDIGTPPPAARFAWIRALPVGAILTDARGDAWQIRRTTAGRPYIACITGGKSGYLASDPELAELAEWAPFRLVWTGAEGDGSAGRPAPDDLCVFAWGESVTWHAGRVLVPLNRGGDTVADLELDEGSARLLADMLADAGGGAGDAAPDGTMGA